MSNLKEQGKETEVTYACLHEATFAPIIGTIHDKLTLGAEGRISDLKMHLISRGELGVFLRVQSKGGKAFIPIQNVKIMAFKD